MQICSGSVVIILLRAISALIQGVLALYESGWVSASTSKRLNTSQTCSVSYVVGALSLLNETPPAHSRLSFLRASSPGCSAIACAVALVQKIKLCLAWRLMYRLSYAWS